MTSEKPYSSVVSDAAVKDIFRRFQAANPSPQTELKYKNPYTLLVAVVLSAQATDVGVNKATGPLFERVDNPFDMVRLGEENLIHYIKTIGLFRAKAKNVIALSQRLLDHYHGQVPASLQELQSLPGVGQKTANVVLNVVFGHLTLAVDTHIFRLSNRIAISLGKTPEEVERGLLQRIPKDYLLHAHHWMILHGRYICKARKPECWHCLIQDLCQYPDKNLEKN